MANLLTYSRRKWRRDGYYVEGTEQINRYAQNRVVRNDLHGFSDLVALKLDDPDEPMVYVQVTSRSNISARKRKILGESVGKGQWAVPIRAIAEYILRRGDRIVIEGWRQNKKTRRYEERAVELTLEDLDVHGVRDARR